MAAVRRCLDKRALLYRAYADVAEALTGAKHPSGTDGYLNALNADPPAVARRLREVAAGLGE